MNGPLFIGGATRSGTTLMARILSKTCTNCAVLPVEGYLDVYSRNWPGKLSGETAQVFAESYMSQGRPANTKRTRWEKPIDSIDKDLSAFIPPLSWKGSREQLFNEVLTKYAQVRSCDSWGLKDTYIEINHKKLMDIYPGCKSIIMVRDPRASLCSELYMGTFPERNNSPFFALKFRLLLWCLTVYTTMNLAKQYPDKVLVVQYEKLVTYPVEVSNQIVDFIGQDVIPFTKDVLPKSFSTYDVNSDDFYKTNNRWMNLLTDNEVSLIERLANNYMKFFNYEITGKKSTSAVQDMLFHQYSKMLIALSNSSSAGVFYWIQYTMTEKRRFVVRMGRLMAIAAVRLGLLNPKVLAGRQMYDFPKILN